MLSTIIFIVLAWGVPVAPTSACEQHTVCEFVQVSTLQAAHAIDDLCRSKWLDFDDGFPLTSSQVNHFVRVSDNFTGYRDFPPGLDASHILGSGLFVFPQYNFAICVITKVGSSSWNDVLEKMIEDDPSAEGKDQFHKHSRHWKGTVAEKNAFFSDPNTTRAVFVREPLSRFASAFLDKCCSEELSHDMCPMKEGRLTPISMKEAVEWMMEANLSTLDVHWLPQSFFCELNSRIAEYSVVGRYSEDTYSGDASCLMKIAGLERYNSRGPEYNNTPYWTTSVNSGPDNIYHKSTDAEERAMLKKLFTPAAARGLIEKLRMDYETFNFPSEPSWVALATGRLYDKVLPGCKR